MHDIKSIRDNPQAFDAGLKRRGLAPLSASLLAIDEKRRAAILASEQAQARRNAASKEIGDAKKAKDETRAAELDAVLYVLLQREQTALLLGSGRLFFVIAALMVATRRIDWYALFSRLRSDAAAPAPAAP